MGLRARELRAWELGAWELRTETRLAVRVPGAIGIMVTPARSAVSVRFPALARAFPHHVLCNYPRNTYSFQAKVTAERALVPSYRCTVNLHSPGIGKVSWPCCNAPKNQ